MSKNAVSWIQYYKSCMVCTLHDKQACDVNTVTIMTAKTFTAGVMLTISPRVTINKFSYQGLSQG